MKEIAEKVHKIVFTGEVDHGKSTLISNLLMNLSGIEISPEERESLYLVDSYQEERMDGITIDTSQFFIEIEEKPFVLIDVPGHLEFLSSMITGASHADVGVVLVDITIGVTEQTRRHLNILRMLSIPRVLGVLTKTDLAPDKDLPEKIDRIASALGEEIRRLFPVFSVTAVSGRTGENIYDCSEARWASPASWLEEVRRLIESPASKEAAAENEKRIIIHSRIERERGRSVALAFVDAGEVSEGDEFFVFGTGEKVIVRELRDADNQISPKAFPEQSLAVAFDKMTAVTRGTILCADERWKDPAVKGVKIHSLWLGETAPQEGSSCLLQCSVQKVPATIRASRSLVSKTTTKGAFLEISLDLASPLLLTPPDQSKYLGVANILMDDRVVGIGVTPAFHG